MNKRARCCTVTEVSLRETTLVRTDIASIMHNLYLTLISYFFMSCFADVTFRIVVVDSSLCASAVLLLNMLPTTNSDIQTTVSNQHTQGTRSTSSIESLSMVVLQ
jgi:hypothetical protein